MKQFMETVIEYFLAIMFVFLLPILMRKVFGIPLWESKQDYLSTVHEYFMIIVLWKLSSLNIQVSK